MTEKKCDSCFLLDKPISFFDILIAITVIVAKALNPLSPSIHMQILQTDLHTFPQRIS